MALDIVGTTILGVMDMGRSVITTVLSMVITILIMDIMVPLTIMDTMLRITIIMVMDSILIMHPDFNIKEVVQIMDSVIQTPALDKTQIRIQDLEMII